MLVYTDAQVPCLFFLVVCVFVPPHSCTGVLVFNISNWGFMYFFFQFCWLLCHNLKLHYWQVVEADNNPNGLVSLGEFILYHHTPKRVIFDTVLCYDAHVSNIDTTISASHRILFCFTSLILSVKSSAPYNMLHVTLLPNLILILVSFYNKIIHVSELKWLLHLYKIISPLFFQLLLGWTLIFIIPFHFHYWVLWRLLKIKKKKALWN